MNRAALVLLSLVLVAGFVLVLRRGEVARMIGVNVSNDSVSLSHFRPSEFGHWWPDMSPELLRKLDAFRSYLGSSVIVSSHPDALGRHLGPSNLSQHNIDRWGEVRAVDVLLPGADLARAYQIARDVGFTGIGVYPDWSPYHGLHLDVRGDRVAGSPATWSRIAGHYVEVERAFA